MKEWLGYRLEEVFEDERESYAEYAPEDQWEAWATGKRRGLMAMSTV